MKLLQYNITSLNTSVEELWLYQQENNYDAIFLQETDYIEGKPLGHFKHWKNRMFTNCQNKMQDFGVGFSTTKKCISGLFVWARFRTSME